MYTYGGDEFEFAFGEAESGFPSIDPDSETDIYIFVLVSTPERESPIPTDTSETDNWVSTHEHTGNYMALILGWMFAHSIQGEAIGNLTDRSGNFTRLHTRDMYEVFMRTSVNPEF
ncbi:hypothetical protein [Halorientalis pallida]|uniref:Uncharacterized protein n=1 Tax=Halorientalis pallida TaxID=2479928 RepID=A0A498KSI2_9EURY|nr:hypothetical protein [Halorientalis pallida]RXK47717.1 hypothetical protein EAF64_13745 [Halorientalis pallida]